MSQWDDPRKPTLWERIVMDWQHDHHRSNIKFSLILIGMVSVSAALWYFNIKR